ncbi:IclR family transcriptional regulator [Halomicroarcula sp. GCM10025817]|uniref:IclR family transcriptional regulator n=1 Tax=Halomicroarcula sp. GCM10025817 TaxID=3252672 RepID=UPI0036182901
MGKEAKHPVQTTAKTLEIIEAIKSLGGAGVTELADEVAMGKSAVHNHLSTLEEYEYVSKADGEYSLGLRFLEIGGYTRKEMDLFGIAKPQVDELAEETGELVNVAVEEHGRCVYLYRSRGTKAVNLDIYAGLRAAMNTTALGKSMLAHMPDARVDEILAEGSFEPATANSITGPAELREEFSKIRAQGYAVDDEELMKGLRCVSAPILSDGEVVGAISISAPTSRLKGKRLEEEFPDQVISAANVIELNIAHS